MSSHEAASVRIDLSAIPNETKDRLAAATLDFIRNLLNDPVSRAALKERIAADKAERSEKP